jgi:hypothetical protein
MSGATNIGFDTFPKQGSFLGKRVDVCFDYNASRVIGGNVIRDDAEAPGLMLIHLDDGRVVRSVECQYSFPRSDPANPN